MIELPRTDAYKPQLLVGHADEVPVPPAIQALPAQEEGIRPARALPYVLHARAVIQADGSVRIDFANTGKAAAVFQVRSGNAAHDPRTYTVEPGKHLSGVWSIAAIGALEYDLSVYGPNGFLRVFKGGMSPAGPRLDVQAIYDEATNRIALTISNVGPQPADISVRNNYTGKTIAESVAVGTTFSRAWSLARSFGWYDLVITIAQDATFEYQVAGHVETRKDSFSDPLMGGLL